MLVLWIVVIVLCVLVLFETVLLVGALRTLGELKQQGGMAGSQEQSSADWGLATGEKAPSFIAVDQDGHTINLEQFRGQKRIVAFISPGCSVCANVIAALNVVASEQPDMVVLAVGDSDLKRNHEYAIEHEARMPILTPSSSIAKDMYRVQGVPFVFVIDEIGTIRAKGIMNDSERLHALLRLAFPSVTVAS